MKRYLTLPILALLVLIGFASAGAPAPVSAAGLTQTTAAIEAATMPGAVELSISGDTSTVKIRLNTPMKQGECLYFSETGKSLCYPMLTFWQSYGGLPVFGLPISQQTDDPTRNDSNLVQWLERARFDQQLGKSAPYYVELGRLGDELLRRDGIDWKVFPKEQPKEGCLYFQETLKNLCDTAPDGTYTGFLSYFRAHGLEFDGQPGFSFAESLALFGLPLSDVQMETVGDGQYLTQWTERARFEAHPENQPPYNVLLGLLGNEAKR